MVRVLDAESILWLWERGLPRRMLDRSLLLGAWARPDLAADAVADLNLGALTADLLRMHAAAFGPALSCITDCQHCGEPLELTLDADTLLRSMSDSSARAPIEAAGLLLRAPSTRDLAAVADERDATHAARVLLARCAGIDASRVAQLPASSVEEAEAAIEALDPNADIAFEVHCELCGARSAAQLDMAVLLWRQIDLRARGLLQDIHVLASVYGWTEGEILGLSAQRRATYRAMVSA